MNTEPTLYTVEQHGKPLAVVRATRGSLAIQMVAASHGISLVGLAARVASDFERRAFQDREAKGAGRPGALGR
jgi:hypothetical protein